MDSLYSKKEDFTYKVEEYDSAEEEEEEVIIMDHKIRYRCTKENHETLYKIFSDIRDYCKENAITMYSLLSLYR